MFNKILKEKVEHQFRTYADFARQAQVSRASVTLWLNGTNKPDDTSLHKITELLDWDYNEAKELLKQSRDEPLYQFVKKRWAQTKANRLRRIVVDMECLPESQQENLLDIFSKTVMVAQIAEESAPYTA